MIRTRQGSRSLSPRFVRVWLIVLFLLSPIFPQPRTFFPSPRPLLQPLKSLPLLANRSPVTSSFWDPSQSAWSFVETRGRRVVPRLADLLTSSGVYSVLLFGYFFLGPSRSFVTLPFSSLFYPLSRHQVLLDCVAPRLSLSFSFALWRAPTLSSLDFSPKSTVSTPSVSIFPVNPPCLLHLFFLGREQI